MDKNCQEVGFTVLAGKSMMAFSDLGFKDSESEVEGKTEHALANGKCARDGGRTDTPKARSRWKRF